MAGDRAKSRAVRGGFEELFGAGFGAVRIHEGALSAADTAAGRIACAYGEDIAFAAGAYDPHSAQGREVIGHELAHVLQQRYGRTGVREAALEAEAILAGRLVAAGVPVRVPKQPRTGAAARRTAQYYTVHAAGAAAPFAVVNPQHHVPPHAQDSFVRQDKVGTSFLAGAAVRLVSANPAGVTLRVSGGNQMAIEHCDLGVRQPKVFYATQAVVDASNHRLALIGSRYRLVADAPGAHQQRVTIAGNTLLRVTAQNLFAVSAGFTMESAQHCNQMIGEVLGINQLFPRFETDPHVAPHTLLEYNIAQALLPGGGPPPLNPNALAASAPRSPRRTAPPRMPAQCHSPASSTSSGSTSSPGQASARGS